VSAPQAPKRECRKDSIPIYSSRRSPFECLCHAACRRPDNWQRGETKRIKSRREKRERGVCGFPLGQTLLRSGETGEDGEPEAPILDRRGRQPDAGASLQVRRDPLRFCASSVRVHTLEEPVDLDGGESSQPLKDPRSA